MKLQGIYPALATCFDDDGNVYKGKIVHNIRKLNEIALSGYLVCGSTGEAPLMNAQERTEVLECVRQVSADGKILIAGIGAESVRESVRMANHAADIGYQVGLALSPHYYQNQMHRPEVQLLYYRALADQSRIPVLIYNMPAVTGYDLPVEMLAELSHHPNIVGMKDSSGNIEKMKATLKAVRPGFQVLSGSGITFGHALELGAAGAILAIANAVPYACVTVWEALRTRQEEAARDWQSRLLPGAKIVPAKYGIAGLKHAMDLKGYYGGRPRLPLMPPSPDIRMEIEQAFDGIYS
ncbi:MAG: dihydrodipicolinate synthase family protein [Acidobacteriota bacterium]|nr:dihydrodipicolinate synthase family protein [Acidobacteriota bacterium]